MKISFNNTDKPFSAKKGWHLLTVADPGFSTLVFYGEQEYNLDRLVLDEFIDKVNRLNEAGTLHPKAPLSSIPCKFMRELSNSINPSLLEDFKTHITAFLISNAKTIKSENLAIDFRVSASPIPQHYIDATLESLKAYKGKLLKSVIIY